MPSLKDDANYPIWLGPPMESTSDSKVELPKGYQPEVPPNVDLKYDFAEYHASYSRDGDALTGSRRLLIKMREVPVAEFEDYRTFVKDVQNDVNQYVQTSSVNRPNRPSSPNQAMFPAFGGIRELPDSNSSEANRLVADAREKLADKDPQGAVSSLYRAVAADAKFTRAWVLLGILLLQQKQIEAGTDAFHKAMAADPDEAAIPKVLAFGLMADSKYDDAVSVWQDYVKAHPDDEDGRGNLGSCLLKLKRYSEAAAAYEAAVKIRGDRANLQAGLGSAYLLAGERDKAGEAFSKVADLDPDAEYLNDVAYKMANADLRLPIALDYATKAAHEAGEDSQQISLQELKVSHLKQIFTLAANWDTLGWVNERMSNFDVAERYLSASWKMTQDGIVAGHLCQLYERVHKIDVAIQMCRAALYRIPMSESVTLNDYKSEMDAAQKKLEHLTGSVASSKSMTDASDLVIRERTFALPRFLPGSESAEFFVLLASDSRTKKFKVEDVKFISGSEKMKLQGKRLKNIDFNVPAPSDTLTRFVRRGILGCYQYSGCSFVLLDPATVHSLQ